MSLISLEEAKQQLDIESDASDAELRVYVDALDAVIEGIVGPVANRTVTEVVDGSGPVLCLRQVPAVSLTSATPVLTNGTALDVSGLHLDGATGIVRRLDGGCFRGGPWTFAYVAGRGDAALATINLAARILLQHLWRTQYGASRGLAGVGGADDFNVTEPVPGYGYAIPNRVLQLLEPYKAPPGVA
ncbi:hypothetical protein [Streptomyces sp. NPDC102462]|uniref:hypothetical protein n=1 Tax=Streptomyces sp. NPDC102462 TaxID=3366178 RepID=UPI003828A305